MSALDEFDTDRARARAARREAAYLRDLSQIARCGVGMSHGSRSVPTRYVSRVAAQYLVWADDEDALAEAIEAKLESVLASVRTHA